MDWLVGQKAFQVVSDVLGRRVPVLRFLRHSLKHDRFQIGGNRPVELVRLGWIFIDNLPGEFLPVIAGKHRPKGK